MSPGWLWVAAALADGGLQGVVLDGDGRPVAHTTVAVGGATAQTDPDGHWSLRLDPGLVEVQIHWPGGAVARVPQVPVVEGLSTEVLVSQGAPPVITLEAPDVAATESSGPQAEPGTLRGQVTDQDTGRPLAGVRLYVRGVAVEAITDAAGRFELVAPAGARAVTAIRAGYGTASADVEIIAHQDVALALQLAKTGLQLADLTVKAPRIAGGAASLLDERQEAATVSDVLGAEQMSRSGDSDAAAALKRVTGLTVIGGKYVYVRGLGDRYSATLLNGSSLPSPEPERRVVPLDLFPTQLIEAVVIQKTFSPDRPAEFGGGVVEVRSRSIPDAPTLSLSVSGTYDGGTTFSTAEYGDAGPTDWLGFGLDHRALPPALAAASADQPIKAGGIFSDTGYSAEELEEFGELIVNRWGLDPRTLPPDVGVAASGGGTAHLGATRLGAMAGLVWNNGWSVDDGYKATYASGADGLELRRRTDFVETQNRIRLGGALTLGWQADAWSLGSTTLLMRSSAGTALTWSADDPTGSNDTSSVRLSWEEQQLLFEQATGHLALGEVEIDGRVALALAQRAQPDQREYTYLDTEDGLVLSQRGGWNEILYATLRDTSNDLGLDLSAPVGPVDVKLGVQRLSRARASTTRRFSYTFQGSEGIDLSAPMEDVVVPENIGAEEEGDPGYLELEENTTSSDDYSAEQKLQAAFVQGDVRWAPRLSTLVGARVERSSQQVSTFELFDTSQTPVAALLTTTDLLPALTMNVQLGPEEEPDQMLVRVGYGRTLSRPELRELSEVAYYDYRSGRLLYGNPDLQRATIDNLDARWEWYRRAGESLSLGAFFKYFDHPIESVIAVSAVSGSVGTFDNATSATNIGAEVEGRQRLDVVAEALGDWSISANASVIRSRVDLSDTEGNQTSSVRPLQGQSPWVLNAALSYDNPDSHTAVSLLYNVFGPRIVEVGTSGIPDSYEQPVHRLDLVASQGLWEHWTVRLKFANLLNSPIEQTTGTQVSESTTDGRSVGVSVGWSPL